MHSVCIACASLAMMIVGCGTTSEPPTARAAQPTSLFANAQLENAALADYRALENARPLPDDAQHVYLKSETTRDGHIFIVSYQSPSPPPAHFCEATCTDENRINGSLPALWPTHEELHAPRWLVDPPNVQGWSTMTAIPYTTEMGGQMVPCGFSRASGRGVFIETASETGRTRTTIVDFSIQWFRTGCGG